MSTKVYIIDSNQAQYTAEELSGFINELMGEGVFDSQGANNDLEVYESTPNAMTVEVRPGACLVEYTKNGVTWKTICESNDTETLTILANSSGADRVDAIVVHLSQDEPNALKNNVVTIEVVEGTGAVVLTDGAIDSALGDGNWYRIADITVPNGASTITDSDITDTRETVSFGKNTGGYVSRIRGDALTNPVSADIDFNNYHAYDINTLQVNNNGSFGGDVLVSGNHNVEGNIVVSGNATVSGNVTTEGYFIGDGSQLTNLPKEKTYEVGENLTLGDPLKIVDDGGTDKVYKVKGITDAESLTGAFVAYLDDNYIVAVENTGTTTIPIRVYSYDSDGQVSLEDSTTETVAGSVDVRLAVFDASNFIIFYRSSSVQGIKGMVCSFDSGTSTITTNTPVDIDTDTNNLSLLDALGVDRTNGIVVLTYGSGSSTYASYTRGVKRNGTSVTLGSRVGDAYRKSTTLAVTDTDGKFLMSTIVGNGVNQHRARCGTVDSSTANITFGTSITLDSDSDNINTIGCGYLSDSCVLFYYDINGGGRRIRLCSLSGTNLTSVDTITTDIWSTNFVRMFPFDNKYMAIFGGGTCAIYDSEAETFTEFDAYFDGGGTYGLYVGETDDGDYIISGGSSYFHVGLPDWQGLMGVSSETVTSGNTTSPSVLGDIISNLSSLERNVTYYLGADGDVTTTSTDNFKLYRSITDAEAYILIGIDQD